MALTNKQKKFIEEYVIDANATRAYKEAYPSVKSNNTASAAAARLMKNKEIQKYRDELMEQMKSTRVADAQEVIEYLTSVIRGNSTSQEIVVLGVGGGLSEAEKVEKAPSEKDRLKAAELLGKRYGLFKDRVELSGIEKEQSKLDSLLDQLSGDG